MTTPAPCLPVLPPCRHCSRNSACRSRGLCDPCSRDPAIRERYPLKDCRYNARGFGGGNRNPPLPDSPTAAVPGSEAKLAVLAERAAAGVRLHHPDDARIGLT